MMSLKKSMVNFIEVKLSFLIPIIRLTMSFFRPLPRNKGISINSVFKNTSPVTKKSNITKKSNSIRKYDIINWLGENYGYKTYLEIATKTTGLCFSEIDRNIFPVPERLMYRTPLRYRDAMSIDYSTTSDDNSFLFLKLKSIGKKYDVVFVDPWHSYESSLSDLENAIELLNDNGVMVVHDCNPPSVDITSPTFTPGSWVGQTYTAFINFVHNRSDLEYCVVDADFGCGIVRRKQPGSITEVESKLVEDGFQLEVETDVLQKVTNWETFDKYRMQLLRLIEFKHFIQLYRNSEKDSSILSVP